MLADSLNVLGPVKGTNYQENCVNLGNITGVINIDLSAGQYFYGTVVGACTLNFVGAPPAGRAQGITLELTNPGAGAITWGNTIKWPDRTAPSQYTASGIDTFVFLTRDGGVSYIGCKTMTNVGTP